MQKPINRWMLVHLALIVSGAALLAFQFLVRSFQVGEEFVLDFIIIISGSILVTTGSLGLLVQSAMHLLAAKKEPIQLPETTRGK